FNLRTDNWHYLRAAPVSVPRFVLESSIDFSTVLPAVFETTALLHTWLPGSRANPPGRPSLPAVLIAGSLVAGVAAIALMLLQPHYFFPFVWVGLFLLLDPLNAALRAPSLLAAAYRAHWRPLVVLALAGLACGFWWEMWNSLSMPRWYYTVPLVPQQRLFEMPLVGYSGYVPFAWECFAIYTLASRPFRARSGADHTVPLYVPLA
ncbi:MAG: hypothetical protein M3010_10010, partial [Candidatus Dormibacteraeota bacterium]|nr:hypothetical protein [Candidatus Dormibacteraeota bacterium]